MTRWKELPQSLDPRARQLVVQLRRLKDHSGLGFASLGARTTYSKSSWERYLNGKTLPPRQAVVELAGVTAADPARLLALHEVAQTTPAAVRVPVLAPAPAPGAGRAGDAGAADPEEVFRLGAAPAPGRPPRGPMVLTAVVATAVGALLGALLAVQPWDDGSPRQAGEGVSPPAVTPAADDGKVWAHEGAFEFEAGRDHRCEVKRVDGKLYAGHSGTQQAVLVFSSGSWDVVEAQCLLEHHGISPGVVDGAFGDRTERAVYRLQRDTGLVEDGKIGEHTWRELRR